MIEIPFEEFPKIARLSRRVIITEKIDGTNAQVFIAPVPEEGLCGTIANFIGDDGTPFGIYAGSRTRWLQPTKGADNYGFAAWVKENAGELAKLGPGRHFGEWWGKGINRGYDLHEKRFSLFNTHRWGDSPHDGQTNSTRPACCHVVPVLYDGDFDPTTIRWVLYDLYDFGSRAAPGFMRPEGVVIFHTAGNFLFKKTIENDESPKGVE